MDVRLEDFARFLRTNTLPSDGFEISFETFNGVAYTRVTYYDEGFGRVIDADFNFDITDSFLDSAVNPPVGRDEYDDAAIWLSAAVYADLTANRSYIKR
jgi:hypothetical protein